jgi:hypothetical protein
MAVLKPYTAKMIFDSPPEEPNSNEWGEYFTVTVELPEGAPKTRKNEKYERIEGWINYDAEDEVTDKYLRSLSRGDEFQVVWNGKKYVAIVPDPPPSASQENNNPPDTDWIDDAQQSVPQEKQKTEWVPVVGDKEKRFFLARQGADVVEELATMVNIVRANETFSSLSEEEQNRMAITAYIESGKRAYRSDNTKIISLLENEITTLDPEGLPANFLEYCVMTIEGYDSVDQVGAALKALDFSRDDLDPDNPQTWINVYRVARRYALHEFN